MSKVTLKVPDISCEHCERTITGALAPVEGVEAVKVDIPAREVHVDFDESRVDVNRMKAILAEEDYPVAATSA